MKAYGSFSYLRYTKRENYNIIIIIQGKSKQLGGGGLIFFLGHYRKKPEQYFTRAEMLVPLVFLSVDEKLLVRQ